MPQRPTATYRFQLTPTFGFDRAQVQLPRLQALGISHVYLSPITEAVPGSTHGYDVVDHTRVRDELGGSDGLTRLLDACADRAMGVLVDHVPNHTAVGRPELNRHWWAMLRDGPGSDAARWFDVDWALADGAVILPTLGDPLPDVRHRLVVVDGELRLDSQRWPLAPGTEHLPPAEAVDRQHYRLQHWRDSARNVRRFFTIDDLVAVRVEDPTVAAVVDTLPARLADHPGFAGVRVDHVDGLADPLAYLQGLRDLIGDRWLVVEKILAPDETLPDVWPVDGTTGYEHATILEHALLDRDGWSRLRDRWVTATGDGRPFRAWELDARREVLAAGLRPDLERVARSAARALGADAGSAPTVAVATLSVHLERYRTYLPDDEGRPALAAAVREAEADRPDVAATIGDLAAALDEAGEWPTRWQQLTGPATAKGVEDRAFWRYVPLASLGEVGGRAEPDLGADPVGALHAHHARTAARWPTTLLAGTTHDVARAEDVRAAGLALAASARRWIELADAWLAGPGAAIDVDTASHWLALQTVVTTPDLDSARLDAFLVKAAREADVRTSWTSPDATFEGRLGDLAEGVLGWSRAADAAAELDRAGRATSLAMLAVRLTAPGVADVYQGTEGFRHVLVDPDNRAEPDHAALDELVDRAVAMDGRAAWAEPRSPAARAVAIRRLLAVRAGTAVDGYEPLVADDHLVAFARTDADGAPTLVTIAPRTVERPGGLVVDLPAGSWRSVLVDDAPVVVDALALDDALVAFPAVVLVRA